MDAALVKKIGQYASGDEQPRIVESAEAVETNVIKTDAAVFHNTRSKRVSQKPVPEETESDYQSGFEDGQAKAEITYKKTIKVMQKSLAGLKDELATVTEQIERNHLIALEKCLDSVFPALMKAGARQELTRLISQASQLGTFGKIHLIVHPRAKAECQELCEQQSDDFIISTDPTLQPMQVKALWDHGGAEIDCDAAAKALKKPFEKALQTMMTHSKLEP